MFGIEDSLPECVVNIFVFFREPIGKAFYFIQSRLILNGNTGTHLPLLLFDINFLLHL